MLLVSRLSDAYEQKLTSQANVNDVSKMYRTAIEVHITQADAER